MDQSSCLFASSLWSRVFRRPKKRGVILLEILVALSLTAILLLFLFSFFVESAKIEKKLEQARMAISSRAQLQTRLQDLFSSVQAKALETSPLYTKQFDKDANVSLIAIFDQGIDPDPTFSGPILARLYLDEDHNLSLVTWPLSKKKNRPWRKEILLPRVAQFSFEFLGKNEAPKEKGEQIRPITPTCAWKSHLSSQSQIPSIIRLLVQEENRKEPLQFAFLLPHIEPPISYTKRKA